ncbi:MAG: hypothetical protein AB1529_00120 [Candidatus Micrarchaeota archaeon]
MEFWQAYALTLLMEGAALFLFLRGKYDAGIIMRNAVAASSLTLPLVWFFFPYLGLGWGIQTALAEGFAFLAEGGVYIALFRKLDAGGAFGASAACNLSSFLIGLALS